ncbi:hypothetical protein LOTGIDRAFT_174572 [Lottia gigantea]|uniref:Activin types I and II receptor domain-containing protein n=1 Tax=Lottia gigantea TaxID=225164 RepID=V4A012_LOTGI|nr:hypothetical protein LOTGIDRAFT_174572 [Lottia gigantea]ESO97138.1 hypothetical protein LOTGIDRAFT_174572 [Lottia gigantea]
MTNFVLCKSCQLGVYKMCSLPTSTALECDCNTKECEALGMSSCFADKFCFAENFNNKITRGCLDGRTPLLCENWRPKKLNTPWPVVYCCDDEHHCNKDVKPTDPTVYVQGTTVQLPTLQSVEGGHGDDQHVGDVQNSDCEKSETNSSVLRNNGVNKMLNPIYIAVPVAGVCVLLALIIFAMYLLRRRNDYYHHYHYPDHPQHLAQVPCDPKKPGGATCSSVNRCTDSERSSSGSETKLFLQV